MAIININTGSGANSGDGDSIRTAFTKINQNFQNLENSFVGAGVASFNGQGGIITFSSTDIVSLLGYIPYSSTNPQNFLSAAVLDLYATQTYVQNSLTNYVTTSSLLSFVSTSTLADYATLNYVNNTLTNYLTSDTLPGFLSSYVTATFLFSLDYQNSVQVNNLIAAAASGYITTATLQQYATISYVDQELAGLAQQDRIVARDGTGTIVASLIITPSGSLQATPGQLSFQNANSGVLAFDHSNSSTYVKFGGKFPGLTASTGYVFTTVPQDYVLEFNFGTGELLLPTYDSVTQRRSTDVFNQPTRPGFPTSGGSILEVIKPRIFATNYGFTKDLNNTEYFMDWGKAIVLAVDGSRQHANGILWDNGFNYLQVTSAGVEISAHTGTVVIGTTKPIIGPGDTLEMERYFYEFSENGLTFPDGTIQDTAYTGGGGGGGLDTEGTQDVVGSMFAAGVHSGISYSYNDLNNRIDSSVSWGAIPSNLLPTTDLTRSIGSSTLRFRELYVSTATVYTDFLVRSSIGEALGRIRFVEGDTSYGFTSESTGQLVIVNEEATYHQAIVLGDVGNTTGTLFGVSLDMNGPMSTLSTGNEPTWVPKLNLKGNGELELPTGGLRTQGNIVLGTSSTWNITFSDGTTQNTAFTGTAVPSNLTNDWSGSAVIDTNGTTATVGGLNITLSGTPNFDVEVNYSNPSNNVTIDIFRISPSPSNLVSNSLRTPGNTTTTVVSNLAQPGDTVVFLLSDESFHKIYRTTVIARDIGNPSSAYCIIEELK